MHNLYYIANIIIIAYNITIKNVLNPTNMGGVNNFQIKTLYNNVVVDEVLLIVVDCFLEFRSLC